VTYQFDEPPHEIRLRFDEESSELTEAIGLGSKHVPANPTAPVRESAITYEDLSLQFLYWPRPKLLGRETIRTRPAWKLEIQSPRKDSAYGVARLWIDRDSGALLRVDGLNLDGRLMKRFELVSAQKIDGLWVLRSMRVEEFDPETKRIVGRTYLEIKK